MTESEWLIATAPQKMLEFLRGKASDRKLRLFACACCRHYGHLLKDERCRQAVSVAERFSDELATAGELSEAEEAVWGADQSGELAVDGLGPACVYCCYRAEDGSYPSGFAAEVANQMLVAAGDEITSDAAYDAACGVLSNFLRCVFGNPFHPLPPITPSVFAWNDGTIPKLAQAIYEDRVFDRLPILADAVEEAGCSDPDLLGHLRGPGSHVRGCWAVDLILGRE
jgi:hypothetical protein